MYIPVTALPLRTLKLKWDEPLNQGILEKYVPIWAMWGVSKISINIWDIRPNSIVIAICQMTLTFRWRPDFVVWLFVALYEAWSAKNHEQVYGCIVYLKLYFLASLANYKYSSSVEFKLLVAVNLPRFEWIGLGALPPVTPKERWPWARGQQWERHSWIWERTSAQ